LETSGGAEVEEAAHDQVLLLVRLLEVFEVLDPPPELEEAARDTRGLGERLEVFAQRRREQRRVGDASQHILHHLEPLLAHLRA
jgi:hypothetical protein|tara:strand:- start:133 stop:384 length:252 start_codon:yes stop_codon:yes gene_type:complete